MSKYFCSEAANQAATKAVQVLGAAGLMEGNVAERLFRDAREATIPEGTTQMQVLQIGRALLGVSAVRETMPPAAVHAGPDPRPGHVRSPPHPPPYPLPPHE